MKLRTAIKNADILRQNALDDELKSKWIYELEGKVCEVLDKEAPENSFPEDATLVCPAPYDNIYELYVVSMIDYYHGESDSYANDMEMFNAAWNEARAYLRRKNMPKSRGGIKI